MIGTAISVTAVHAARGFRASASFVVADDFSAGVVGTITTSGAEGAVSLVGGAVTGQAGTNSGLFSITTGLEVTLDPQALGAGLTNDGDSTSTSYSIQLSDTVSTIDVTVTVTLRKPDQAPVAAGALADITLGINNAMTAVDVSTDFTDADDTLTFTAAGLVDGLAVSSAGSLTGTPTELVTGRVVTITATDAGGQTATSAFEITVAEALPVNVVFLTYGQSNAQAPFAWDEGASWPTGTLNANNTTEVFDTPVDGKLHRVAGDNMMMWVQFAIDWKAANPERNLILFDGGAGGTAIAGMNKGTTLYNDVVDALNTMYPTLSDVEFGGFLFHQGESDDIANSTTYAADLDQLIDDFRTDVDAASSTSPFIVGEFTQQGIANFNLGGPGSPLEALEQITDRVLHTAYVPSDNPTLPHDPGNVIHFNDVGLRGMGSRYFTALAQAVALTDLRPAAFVVGNWGAATGVGEGEIDITISALPNDNGSPLTDIELSTNVGADWSSLGAATTGIYTVDTLSQGGAIQGGQLLTDLIKVRAVNAGGNSDDSDVKSATAGLPSGITLANIQSIVNGETGGAILISDAGRFQDAAGSTAASNGDRVRLWKDQSTNGHDFVAPSDAARVLASADGLTHPGTTSEYLENTSLPFASMTDHTVFLRVKTTDAISTLMGSSSSSHWGPLAQDNNVGGPVQNGGTPTVHADNGIDLPSRDEVHDAAATGSHVVVEMRGADMSTWPNIRTFFFPVSSFCCAGDLDAMIFVPESVSSANRGDILSYLLGR